MFCRHTSVVLRLCISAHPLRPDDYPPWTHEKMDPQWHPKEYDRQFVSFPCIYLYIYILLYMLYVYIYTHMCEFTEGSTPAAPKGKNYLVLWVEVWKTIKKPIGCACFLEIWWSTWSASCQGNNVRALLKPFQETGEVLQQSQGEMFCWKACFGSIFWNLGFKVFCSNIGSFDSKDPFGVRHVDHLHGAQKAESLVLCTGWESLNSVSQIKLRSASTQCMGSFYILYIYHIIQYTLWQSNHKPFISKATTTLKWPNWALFIAALTFWPTHQFSSHSIHDHFPQPMYDNDQLPFPLSPSTKRHVGQVTLCLRLEIFHLSLMKICPGRQRFAKARFGDKAAIFSGCGLEQCLVYLLQRILKSLWPVANNIGPFFLPIVPVTSIQIRSIRWELIAWRLKLCVVRSQYESIEPSRFGLWLWIVTTCMARPKCGTSWAWQNLGPTWRKKTLDTLGETRRNTKTISFRRTRICHADISPLADQNLHEIRGGELVVCGYAKSWTFTAIYCDQMVIAPMNFQLRPESRSVWLLSIDNPVGIKVSKHRAMIDHRMCSLLPQLSTRYETRQQGLSTT